MLDLNIFLNYIINLNLAHTKPATFPMLMAVHEKYFTAMQLILLVQHLALHDTQKSNE